MGRIIFGFTFVLIVSLFMTSLFFISHSFIRIGSFNLSEGRSITYTYDGFLVVYSSGVSRVIYNGIIESILINESEPFPPGDVTITGVSNTTIGLWVQTSYYVSGVKFLFATFFISSIMVFLCLGSSGEGLVSSICFSNVILLIVIFMVTLILMIAPSIFGFPPNYHTYRVEAMNETDVILR